MYIATAESKGGKIVSYTNRMKNQKKKYKAIKTGTMNYKETKMNINIIKDEQEKQVVELLNRNGKTMYGNVIKELNTGVITGQRIIFSLISKGIIKNYKNSSYLELNIELSE